MLLPYAQHEASFPCVAAAAPGAPLATEGTTSGAGQPPHACAGTLLCPNACGWGRWSRAAGSEKRAQRHYGQRAQHTDSDARDRRERRESTTLVVRSGRPASKATAAANPLQRPQPPKRHALAMHPNACDPNHPRPGRGGACVSGPYGAEKATRPGLPPLGSFSPLAPSPVRSRVRCSRSAARPQKGARRAGARGICGAETSTAPRSIGAVGAANRSLYGRCGQGAGPMGVGRVGGQTRPARRRPKGYCLSQAAGVG